MSESKWIFKRSKSKTTHQSERKPLGMLTSLTECGTLTLCLLQTDWAPLRAHRLHFRADSRRSAAPPSGLQRHREEKLSDPGERPPLKRQHRCLHSGKKKRHISVFRRIQPPAIRPKAHSERLHGSQRLRRHSPSAFVLSLNIFCMRKERLGLRALARVESSCPWIPSMFLASFVSADSAAAARFACWGFLNQAFIVRVPTCIDPHLQ